VWQRTLGSGPDLWGVCQTNTEKPFGHVPDGRTLQFKQADAMTRRNAALPIGRTAKVAYEIDALRADCCKTAQALMRKANLDEAELEECARLDDALARAHRLLKSTVRGVIMTRLNRRSRTRQ